MDGSQGFNHFSYFSITVMQLDSLIYANDIPMFDTLLVWMATTQNKLKEINIIMIEMLTVYLQTVSNEGIKYSKNIDT